MADSTQFQIDIDVPSGGTSAAADAVTRLAQQLEAAGGAASAAAEAVKAGEAAYSQAEKSAVRAALAVEKIGLAADAQAGKLAKALEVGDEAGAVRAATALEKLTQRQAEAVAKSEAAKAALAGEAAALDKLRSSASAAEAAEDKLSKAHKQATEIAKATDKASQQAAAGLGKTSELAEGFGKLGGPLGVAGQRAFGAAEAFKKLGSSAGAAGPYIAVAIAFTAIATAVAAATIALTIYAVKLGDANRTQSLLFAGITQSVKGGAELEDHIDALTKKVPQSSEKLRSMAADLAKTGLRGKELGDALDRAAVKAAKAEFGPEWEKQMFSISKQTELLQGHFSKLFGGLKIDKLLEGFSKLVGLFDDTSVTGKAIKVVFDSLMQPLIDGLVELVPVIVRTFIQFEIWALRALIAIKPYGNQIETVAKALGTLALIVGGALAVAFGILAVASVAFVTVLSLAVKGAIATGEAFLWLLGKGGELIDYLSGLSLSDIGTALVEGLAKGITDGGDSILKAMTGAVGGAIDGAKKMLGIASPSKVFAEIGAHTAEGMAQGVDSGAADVQGSLAALVDPSAAAAAPGAPATAPTASAGGDKNFSGATFNFYGVKDAKDALDMFLAAIEGGVDQLGAAEPAVAR